MAIARLQQFTTTRRQQRLTTLVGIATFESDNWEGFCCYKTLLSLFKVSILSSRLFCFEGFAIASMIFCSISRYLHAEQSILEVSARPEPSTFWSDLVAFSVFVGISLFSTSAQLVYSWRNTILWISFFIFSSKNIERRGVGKYFFTSSSNLSINSINGAKIIIKWDQLKMTTGSMGWSISFYRPETGNLVRL